MAHTHPIANVYINISAYDIGGGKGMRMILNCIRNLVENRSQVVARLIFNRPTVYRHGENDS